MSTKKCNRPGATDVCVGRVSDPTYNWVGATFLPVVTTTGKGCTSPPGLKPMTIADNADNKCSEARRAGTTSAGVEAPCYMYHSHFADERLGKTHSFRGK